MNLERSASTWLHSTKIEWKLKANLKSSHIFTIEMNLNNKATKRMTHYLIIFPIYEITFNSHYLHLIQHSPRSNRARNTNTDTMKLNEKETSSNTQQP